jgi:hypothetical protein
LQGDASHDLDIALDNMMGKEFTEKINEYLIERKRGRGEGDGRGKKQNRRGVFAPSVIFFFFSITCTRTTQSGVTNRIH